MKQKVLFMRFFAIFVILFFCLIKLLSIDYTLKEINSKLPIDTVKADTIKIVRL